ncbi:MAG TPA: ABC transporter permease [Thermomicrobiales bacterium]|nr:ABC transporter permease [Thermomicrobiales bacterium]
MGAFILRRLLLLIPVLLGVSIVVFTMIHAIPGDPTQILVGTDQLISDEQREVIREQYGLDQPLPVQYGKWIGRVLQGDLGTSIRTRRALTYELRLRLPVTIELTLLAALLGTIPAVAVGVLAAVRRNSRLDYFATVTTLVGISVPNFLLATLLVLLFSVKLKWLPPIGYVSIRQDAVQNLKVMIMPAVSLALPLAAILMRYTRSSVLEVLSSDHVRVARAKGLSQRTVLGRHVLRNASIPIITIAGIQVATLLGGTVIIERIFSLPGIGSYIVDGINNRDYAVVTSVTLVMSTIFVLVSLLVDILYAVMDPRLRKGT